MSKYMLIMRGTDESNAAMMADIDEMMAATRQFIEEMIKAGVLLAAEGLDDPAQGVVVDFSGEAPVVTDGPYGETKELFGGYFLLDVASKQEAVEWAKRVPAVRGVQDRGPAGGRRGRGPAGREHRTPTADGYGRRRGRLADRVGADRRRADPVHRRFRAGRGRGPGGGGRGAGVVAARRAGQPGRLADGHGPAAGDRRDPPPGRPAGPVRPAGGRAPAVDATRSTPTGSTTTSWR